MRTSSSLANAPISPGTSCSISSVLLACSLSKCPVRCPRLLSSTNIVSPEVSVPLNTRMTALRILLFGSALTRIIWANNLPLASTVISSRESSSPISSAFAPCSGFGAYSASISSSSLAPRFSRVELNITGITVPAVSAFVNAPASCSLLSSSPPRYDSISSSSASTMLSTSSVWASFTSPKAVSPWVFSKQSNRDLPSADGKFRGLH